MHARSHPLPVALLVFALACGGAEESPPPSATIGASPSEASETEVTEATAEETPEPVAEPPAEPTYGGDMPRERRLNGRWRVTRIGTTDVPEDAGLVLELDLGSVTGTSGCGAITARARFGAHGFRFADVERADESCDAASLALARSLVDAMNRTDNETGSPSVVLFLSAPAPGELPETLFIATRQPEP